MKKILLFVCLFTLLPLGGLLFGQVSFGYLGTSYNSGTVINYGQIDEDPSPAPNFYIWTSHPDTTYTFKWTSSTEAGNGSLNFVDGGQDNIRNAVINPDANWYGNLVFRITVEAGDDANDNGILEPGEVAETGTIDFDIDVQSVNDIPQLTNINVPAVAEGANFGSPVFDLDDYLTDADHADNEIGFTFAGNTDLGISINANHEVDVTIPNLDWFGSETVTFTAEDPEGAQATVDVIFTVNNVPDAPVFDISQLASQLTGGRLVFNEDETLNVDFSACITDADYPYENETITVSIDGTSASVITGLTFNANQAIGSQLSGTLGNASGQENNSGIETVTLIVTDSHGLPSATQTVDVEIIPQNDIPVVNFPDQVAVQPSDFVQLDLYDMISDVETADVDMIYGWQYLLLPSERDLGVQVIDDPTNDPGNYLIQVTKPSINWVGSETIRFFFEDEAGVRVQQDVTFTVQDNTSAPLTFQVSYDGTGYDHASSDDVTLPAVDEDDINSIFNLVANENNELSGTDEFRWSYTLRTGNADINFATIGTRGYAGKKIIVNPADDFNGPVIFDVTVRGIKYVGLEEQEISYGFLTFDFTVNPTPDPPVITDIPNQSTIEGTAFNTIDLNTYVSDVDEPVNPNITWSWASTNGFVDVTIDASNIATVTPTDPNWNGSDTVTFTATDVDGLSDSDTADFEWTPVPDPPVIDPIADQVIIQGSTVVFAPVALDDYVFDPENTDNTLAWTIETAPAEYAPLTVVVDPNRNLRVFAPDVNYSGSKAITLRSTDPTALFDEVTVNYIVDEVPVLVNIPDQIINEGETFATLDLDDLVTDGDHADSELVWAITGTDSLLTSIDENNVLTVTIPSANFNGIEDLLFTVTDPYGASDSQTVRYQVTPVNDAPTFTTLPIYNIQYDQVYNYNIAINDVEGDDVDITCPTKPAWLTFSADHATLTANLNGVAGIANVGTHQVVLKATDIWGAETEQAFSINVLDDNTPPVLDFTALAQPVNMIEDQPVTIDFTPYVSDADGDVVTLSVHGNTNLTAEVNGLSITFTPVANFFGNEQLIIRADDNQPASTRVYEEEFLNFAVAAVADAPIFTSLPILSSFYDTAYTYNITAEDPDGTDVVITAETLPAWLNFTDNGDGTATLTGTAGTSNLGNHDVSLKVVDADLAEATQDFTINVSDSNHPPVIDLTGLDVSFNEDGETTIDFSGFVSDADDDPLTIEVLDNARINTRIDGLNVTFTATANWYGTETLRLRVDDGQQAFTRVVAEQFFDVNVAPVADAPLFTSTPELFASFNTEYSYNISTVDFDGEGRNITSANTPAWLTFTDNGNGTATLVGTPVLADEGNHNIRLRVTDTASLFTEQSFIINVSGNHPPVIDFAGFNVNFDEDGQSNVINLLDYITDADGDGLNISVNAGANLATSLDGTNLIIRSATANWFGTSTVTVSADDGVNRAFTSADLDVTVNSVNDAPVFTTIPSNFATIGELYEWNIVATDVEGDAITITCPTSLPWLTFIDNGNGTARLFGTPTNTDVGGSIIAVATDANGANTNNSFAITVLSNNHAPTIDLSSINNIATNEDTQAVIDFTSLVDDEDGDDLTLSIDDAAGIQNIEINGLTATFTPVANFNGTVILTVTVDDGVAVQGSRAFAQDSFNMIVNPIDDLPVFDTLPVTSVVAGELYSYTVLAHDIDGTDVTITASGLPAWLSIQTLANGRAIISGTPDIALTGTFPITVTATDADGSSNQNYDLEVVPTGVDLPRINLAGASVNFDQNSSLEFDFSPYITYEGTGTLILTISNNNRIRYTIAGLTAVFTADNNWFGTEDLTVTIDDGMGTRYSDSDFLRVTVNPLSTAPAFESLPIQFATVDLPYNYRILASDPDNSFVTLAATTLPSWLTLTQVSSGTANLQGTPTTANLGNHEVVITATDEQNEVTEQRFNIYVSTNHVPTIDLTGVNVEFGIGENFVLDCSPYVNDADNTNDELSLRVENNNNINVDIDGLTLTFTSTGLWYGTERLIITVDDGQFRNSRAFSSDYLNVTVTEPGNLDPEFVTNPSLFATFDVEYVYDVVAVDRLGETVIITAPTLPAWASFQNLGNGQARINGTPSVTDAGNHAFALVATDATGNTANQNFTVNVSANHVPVIDFGNDFVQLDEDSSTVFDLTPYITDADNATVAITATETDEIDVVVNGMELTITPIANYNGRQRITVTADDGVTTRAYASADLDIVVNPVNDIPVITSTPYNWAQIDVMYRYILDVTDIDGDDVSASLTTAPAFLTIRPYAENKFVVEGTPVTADIAAHNIVIAVTDGIETVNQNFTLNVVEEIVPIIDLDAVSLTMNEDDSNIVFDVSPYLTNVESISVTNTAEMTATVDGFNITFTPAADYNGTVNFPITAHLDTMTATDNLTIVVNPANDAPTIDLTGLTIEFNEDEFETVDFSPYINDIDNTNLQLSVSGLTNITVAVNGNSITFNAPANWNGNETATITVDDLQTRAQASADIVVTVTPVEDMPEFTTTPVTNVFYADTYTYNIEATDNDGDTVTITANTALPAWLTLTQTRGTAVLTGTPGIDNTGDFNISLKAADVNNNEVIQSFTINVGDNHAPVITALADVTFDEEGNTVVDYTNAISDADGDDITITISDDDNINAEINGLQVTYTATENWFGTTTVTLTADDSIYQATADQTITVNNVNDAPVITSVPIEFATLNEAYAYNVTTSDIENNPITLTANIPAWLSFTDNGNGTAVLSGIPGHANSGTHNIEIMANDGFETVNQNFVLTVSDNHAPIFVELDQIDIRFNEDENVTIDFAGYIEDEDNDSMSLSVSNNTEIAYEVNGTEITFSATENFNGTEDITLTVDDGISQTTNRASTSAIKTVTVLAVNDAPTIANQPANVEFKASAGSLLTDYVLAEMFNDVDTDDNLTFELLDSDNIDASEEDGKVELTVINGPWFGTQSISIKAVDTASAEVTVSFNVTVINDITPPEIEPIEDQMIMAIDTEWEFDGIESSGDAVLSLEVAPVGMTIDSNSGKITWTPTANQTDVYNITVLGTNPNTTDVDRETFKVIVVNVNDAPKMFEVTNPFVSEAELTWKDPTSTKWLTNYNVYESSSIDGTFALNTTATNGSTDDNSKTIEVEPGYIKYFKVSANLAAGNYTGESSFSDIAGVYPPLEFEDLHYYDDLIGLANTATFNLAANNEAGVNFDLTSRNNEERKVTKVLAFFNTVPTADVIVSLYDEGNEPTTATKEITFEASSLIMGWNILEIPYEDQLKVIGSNFFVTLKSTNALAIGIDNIDNGHHSVENSSASWQQIATGELKIRAILSPAVSLVIDTANDENNPLNFGRVSLNKVSSTKTINIKNFGLKASAVRFTAPSGFEVKTPASDWAKSVSFALALTESMDVEIRFVPTMGGTYNSNVRVNSDYSDQNEFKYYVTGIAVNSMPNSFSPNGDGLNDEFRLNIVDFKNAALKLTIYNRRGKKLKEISGTSNAEIIWNGRDDDNDECAADVYLYVLRYNNEIRKRGKIYLVR